MALPSLRFTNTYHAYSLTRRGFGYSSKPSTGYDFPTLARDVAVFMDSMHCGSAVIAGHSIGRVELTWLATMYPQRVKKLVYLDAAYELQRLPPIEFNPPKWLDSLTVATETDLSSPEQFQQYLLKCDGILYPLTEINAIFAFDTAGQYLNKRYSDAAIAEIDKLDTTQEYNYSAVRQPLLAVYSIDSSVMTEWFEYLVRKSGRTLDPSDNAFINDLIRAIRTRAESASDRLHEQLPQCKIVFLDAAHHSFITDPDEVERAMRKFMEEK